MALLHPTAGANAAGAAVPEGSRIAVRAAASIGLAWRRRTVLPGIPDAGGVILPDVLDDTATAIVAAPIAKAQRLGISSDPFPMAVAAAASCASLASTGHEDDMRIPAPGGHSLGDWCRMALPLEIRMAALSMSAILGFCRTEPLCLPHFGHMGMRDGVGNRSGAGPSPAGNGARRASLGREPVP